MIVETSILGCCVIGFLVVVMFFLFLGLIIGELGEEGGTAIIIIAIMMFIICWIPNKYYITRANITERAIVGNNVVFVIDGEIKSYNDIETLKNMNNVKFEKTTSVNIFGYNIDESIQRVK